MWGSGCLSSTAEALPPSRRRPVSRRRHWSGSGTSCCTPRRRGPTPRSWGSCSWAKCASGLPRCSGCRRARCSSWRGGPAACSACPSAAAGGCAAGTGGVAQRRGLPGRPASACALARLGAAQERMAFPAHLLFLWLPLPQLARCSKPCPCSSWCTLFNFVTSSGASFGMHPPQAQLHKRR